MKRHPLKQLFGSVFTRLLVTILAAGLAITFMVIAGFITIRVHSQGAFERNLALYAEYLKQDLGNPPDEIRARDIARRSGMVIRFDHPNQTWQTGQLPRFLNLDRAWVHRHPSGLVFGNSKGHQFIRLPHGGGQLTFIAPRGPRRAALAVWFLAALALGMLAILGLAYFIIRKTLSPLRTLKSGVEEVGAGSLDHRIPAFGAVEFRDLAGAFNAMASRLQRLIRNKEQLLLDVSHELRSPITRMKVQLEFLDDAAARDSLGSDLGDMEAMVTTLLESARLRHAAASLNPATVDMGRLIRSLLVEFDARPPGIVPGPLSAAPVKADAEKIKTVLRNLLDNALKHTPAEGPAVEISLTQAPDTLDIVVHDHGEGIPEADMPHLFDPFYRVDRSRSRKTGGYGLGLSLCKAIVDAHHGHLDLLSILGEGTRVTVSLPLGNEAG
jgi:signal transduction histidine kinase